MAAPSPEASASPSAHHDAIATPSPAASTWPRHRLSDVHAAPALVLRGPSVDRAISVADQRTSPSFSPLMALNAAAPALQPWNYGAPPGLASHRRRGVADGLLHRRLKKEDKEVKRRKE